MTFTPTANGGECGSPLGVNTVHPKHDSRGEYGSPNPPSTSSIHHSSTIGEHATTRKKETFNLPEWLVSLDGFRETHEKLRRGANYGEIAVNLLKFMRKRKERNDYLPLVRLQIIDIPETREEIESFKRFWQEKVDVIYVKNLEVFSHTLGDRNLDGEEIRKRLENRKPCKQLWFCLTVGADEGNMYYCCHDPKGLSLLGNIYSLTLKQAWNKLKEIRENHRHGEYTDLCKKCVDYEW